MCGMTLNEILTKRTILNAVLLKDEKEELSKALKVKIVRLRIAYNKIKEQSDKDIQEFTNNLISPELRDLQEKYAEAKDAKSELSMEEMALLESLVNDTNAKYNEFMANKGEENIELNVNDSFTEEEFDEIIGVNAGNEVMINDNKVKGEDLAEVFFKHFIENN